LPIVDCRLPIADCRLTFPLNLTLFCFDVAKTVPSNANRQSQILNRQSRQLAIGSSSAVSCAAQ